MALLFSTSWRSMWTKKLGGVEFLFRQGLSKLPYILVPVRLRVSPSEEIEFRWSYVVPFHDKRRRFFDYWGHDLAELRFLWRVLTPGMIFLDIGAFHGIYTLVAAKRLGQNGQTIAFEPSPKERRRLRLHVRLNGFHSVRVEPCALGAVTSESAFFQVVAGDATRGGLRPPASRDVVKRIPTQIMQLDEYIFNGPMHRVDVIKLDVEGGELDIFRGATRVLVEMRPILICEVLDGATRAWGYDAKEIISALRRFDFVWFDFNSDGSVVPHRARDQYPEVRNYLAVPREKCKPGATWAPR